MSASAKETLCKTTDIAQFSKREASKCTSSTEDSSPVESQLDHKSLNCGITSPQCDFEELILHSGPTCQHASVA